jgi:acetoacetate decarboxylase
MAITFDGGKTQMKIEVDKFYRMPLIMGPLATLHDRVASQIQYKQVEVVALQYQTDPEAIRSLLPDCYRPAKNPTVTVVFGYNDKLEFMAGGGYRLAAVQVAAIFDGEQDQVEGDYVLVMFEDQTWPIIGGREDLGIPKLYADITPLTLLPDNHLRCEASLWGHLLFGVDLSPERKQNPVARLAANRMINARPWLGYKYIPSLDGPPDASYPTVSKNDTNVRDLWFSESAKVYYGEARFDDIAYSWLVIDALRSLQVVKFERALHYRGSSVLRYDLSRRLR